MIRIAQASSSENYGKYGVAPNQRRTGVTKTKPEGNLDGELNVVSWYGGWEKAYRPIDPAIAEKIANFAYRAVANGNYIGYSWSGNTQLFDALKEKGSTDPMDVDTLVNCDCATLVGAAIWYSGIHADGLRALVTWKMDDVLGKTNAFNVLTTKELCEQGKGIHRGDILLKSGHTAVCLDTDESGQRVRLNNDGLFFYDEQGKQTGKYGADAYSFLRDNGLRTVRLSGNAYYLYSSKGTSTYNLETDNTYLVTFCNRNSSSSTNDAVWIISAHKDASHIFALKSSTSTKASVSGLILTINRGAQYGRVTITRLS